MIIGCGIDLVDIERIKKLIKKWDIKFLKKVYTDGEINYCEKKNRSKYQSYAGFYAAKEACLKALGTGLRKIKWKEIEVRNDPLGKPLLYLSERILKVTENRKIHRIHLSISHTKELAIAQAIMESKE